LQFLGVVGGYLVAGDDHKMVEDRIEILLCNRGKPDLGHQLTQL
jgi:hypothetical protein